MKLNFTKSIFILGLVFCLSPTTKSFGQDFVDIFRASEEDVTQYLDSYIEPAMFSFANGMAGGWYNTAKTHKPLGFDITATVNVANIPNSERLFLFDPSDYGNIRLSGDVTNSQTAQLPTLVGGDASEDLELYGTYTAPDGSTYEYATGDSFQAPDGIVDASDLPLAGVPAPTVQLGIGLIKNTDLKIRYGAAKNISANDGTNNKYGVSIFGVGIMHDFKQWIPGIKHLPLDMALFVGYSRFKTTIDFDESNVSFDAEGTASLTANNTTIQALVSKKLSILTLYGGIGYNIVSSGIKVDGRIENYELTDVITGDPYVVEDPVDFTYDGGSTFRATAGMRLKLAFITLHTDYTFQTYNMLSAGLGFTFR